MRSSVRGRDRAQSKSCAIADYHSAEGQLAVASRSNNLTPSALRNRRYRARIRRHEAVGRFLITERLISRLVYDGEITDAAAMTISGIESGVARLLKRYEAGLEGVFDRCNGEPASPGGRFPIIAHAQYRRCRFQTGALQSSQGLQSGSFATALPAERGCIRACCVSRIFVAR